MSASAVQNGNGASAVMSSDWASSGVAERQATRERSFRDVAEMMKRAGREEHKREQERIREERITRAKIASMEIIRALSAEQGIGCRRVYLRVNGDKSFSAIFFFDAEVFFDDGFDEAYDVAWSIVDQMRSEGFVYDFSLSPIRGEISHVSLQADGYWHWFSPDTRDRE